MLELTKGTEIQGRYVVHEVIGHGGYASVWKASDKQLNRDVALKRLIKTSSQMREAELDVLVEEAQKHAKLIHPNIVQVHDIIKEQGEYLLVLEYVDGPSLHKLLRDAAIQSEVLPLDQSVSILRDVLAGVAAAHDSGICHRDLGPMNIVLTSSGVPKVGDFGIAKMLEATSASDGSSTTSQAGTGNPEFMAPEQARGEPADFHSDLFMVGISGYLLLSGRHPFAHPSGLFTVAELLKDPTFSPEPLKPRQSLSTSDQQLFREYAAVVMRLLHREKASRFSSARDAIEAIDAVTPSQKCPNCGERVPEDHKYCGICGSLLRADEDEGQEDKPAEAALPDQPDALVESGFQLAQRKHWNDAIRMYRLALEKDPNHAKAHWNIAYALNRTGHHVEAESILSKALELEENPFRAGMFYERSYALTNLKRFDEALRDINEALVINPRSPRYRFFRSRLHRLRGDLTAAREDATDVLHRIPRHTGAIRLLRDIEGATTSAGVASPPP